jgi:2-polyprenyl-3-methyl-5-hydroxy-6-metoxy-1,4-benzoquinol methylase/RimJ/RimL family protein N-acetyltransferase
VPEAKPRIVVDPVYGHRRLEPAPGSAELERYYQSRYYHRIRKDGRAAGLERLLGDGPEAERERDWLRGTLYGDIAETLGASAPGARVLDVGCGTGDLVAALAAAGLDAQGIEPSEEAAGAGRRRGLRIHAQDLNEFATRGERFDALTLINVLEHVPDPAQLLGQIAALLHPQGVLCVQVPNDFSRLQTIAQRFLAKPPWWIAVPDHVSYFDFASLAAFLSGHGFEPFDVQADFPMELFLLLGEDYVDDPELGRACHARRVELETAIPRQERRALYRQLARAGVGRNCLVFARRAGQGPRVDMTRLERRAHGYRFVGLRHADIQALRRWRNQQIDVLRQRQPLSEQDQERWYRHVVQPGHASGDPEFLLVSILDEADRFVGYGGLTHIDWEHRRGEVSFLVETERARNAERYARDLEAFLAFLSAWAFDELGLERIFTETYAFREAHIALLENAGFVPEGLMTGHVRHQGRAVDCLLHALVRDA